MAHHHSGPLATTAAFQFPSSLIGGLSAWKTATPTITIPNHLPLPIIQSTTFCETKLKRFPPARQQSLSRQSNSMASFFRQRRKRSRLRLHASSSSFSKDDNDGKQNKDEKKTKKKDDSDQEYEEEKRFLERELEHVDSLEEILQELEAYGGAGMDDNDEAEDDDDDFFFDEWDEETLEELFRSLPDDGDDDEEEDNDETLGTYLDLDTKMRQSAAASLLENALLQGVVPANAGVGKNSLPGDYDFDPLNLSTKDYFPKAQAFFRELLPARDDEYVDDSDSDTTATNNDQSQPRPRALILRDYRESEIRHGRLAMLAAVFWPLQELLDRLVLDEDKFDSLLHSLFFGGVTLPYFPLLMTAIMLLLGYLDIYSQAIKDMDRIGEAFLPGDCFWDPLQILTAAPDQMKRNMQERELFNGRFAMLAIAVFIWEEATTGRPLVSIEGNEILFEPAYQVPFIQNWLDERFATPPPLFFDFDEQQEQVLDALTSVDSCQTLEIPLFLASNVG